MTEISLRFEPPFARIVLNRPDRRNAITRAMWRALPAIRAAIEAREDLLVALVEGEGAHFSAGADIVELGEVYRDAAATRDYGDAVQDGLKALMGLDRPTIAVIRGVAIGAGLGLALACDLRFCADDAHLAITPAKLGLVYGHAETRRLIELVGPSRAKDLFSPRAGSRPTRRWRSDSSTGGSRPHCRRQCSATPAAWPSSARPRSEAASARLTPSWPA